MSVTEIKYDEFGPEIVMQVYDAKTGMRGFTVVDNTAIGIGKGGMRLVPNVTVDEVRRLARAMTWKNSLAEIPFGGAKSGIVGDPARKTELVRAFAEKIRTLIPDKYCAGPDINTTEEEMRVFADTIGDKRACTGKPSDMGGLPHELGSTGFGVAHSTFVTLELMKMPVEGATIAIEGYGNVGTFAHKFLTERGAKVVAVSDSKGTIYDANGLDYEKLMEAKKSMKTVTAYKNGSAKVLSAGELFTLPVDVLMPGARPDVIHDGNKAQVKAKIIVEAANIPMSESNEEELWARGIVVVPDFVANAGGVISSYVEYIGGTQQQMFKTVEEKIVKNTRVVVSKALETKKSPRAVALEIAQQRVREAAEKKGR